MAVDTPLKRKAASGVTGIPLGPGVTPDATEPQPWRQTVGWSYPIEIVPGAVVTAKFLAEFPTGYTADFPTSGFLAD